MFIWILVFFVATVATFVIVVASIFAIIRKYFINSPTADTSIDLARKVCIITGGTDGIGLETARGLAKMNATIVLAARNREKAIKAIEYIRSKTDNKELYFIPLDLADLDSVVNFVREFRKLSFRSLDILVNNAGCIVDVSKKKVNKDGYEYMVAVNHFGHFLLTKLLINDLVQSRGRVVVLTSSAHKWISGDPNTFDIQAHLKYPLPDESYLVGSFIQYGFSKLCNIWMANEFHERYHSQGVLVNSVHPGAVRTSIQPKFFPRYLRTLLAPIPMLFFRTAENGAQTSIHVATSPEVKEGGLYYSSMKVSEPSELAKCKRLQKQLWDISCAAVEKYEKQLVS